MIRHHDKVSEKVYLLNVEQCQMVAYRQTTRPSQQTDSEMQMVQRLSSECIDVVI